MEWKNLMRKNQVLRTMYGDGQSFYFREVSRYLTTIMYLQNINLSFHHWLSDGMKFGEIWIGSLIVRKLLFNLVMVRVPDQVVGTE